MIQMRNEGGLAQRGRDGGGKRESALDIFWRQMIGFAGGFAFLFALACLLFSVAFIIISHIINYWLRDWTWVSHTAGRFFTIWATREALVKLRHLKSILSFFFILKFISKGLNFFPQTSETEIGLWYRSSAVSATLALQCVKRYLFNRYLKTHSIVGTILGIVGTVCSKTNQIPMCLHSSQRPVSH